MVNGEVKMMKNSIPLNLEQTKIILAIIRETISNTGYKIGKSLSSVNLLIDGWGQ